MTVIASADLLNAHLATFSAGVRSCIIRSGLRLGSYLAVKSQIMQTNDGRTD